MFSGESAATLGQLNHFPKLALDGSEQTNLHFTYGGSDYQIQIDPLPAGELGKVAVDASIEVTMRLRTTSRDSSCLPASPWSTYTLTMVPSYTEDNDGRPFVREDGGQVVQLPMDFLQHHDTEEMGGLDGFAGDATYQGACSSSSQWDDNATSSSHVAYPTSADPLGRGASFARGDMIPWDWVVPSPFGRSARDEILRHLAPNTAVLGEYALDTDGERIPDFRLARYFEETVTDGWKHVLRPEYESMPPVVSGSGTPLYGSLTNFEEWFDDWVSVAQAQDPSWDCRELFVVLLTDGGESCLDDDADEKLAEITQALYNNGSGKPIRTFVIGLGPSLDSGQLDVIADNGGTGAGDMDGNGVQDCLDLFPDFVDANGNGQHDRCEGPPTAESQEDLVNALKQVFGGSIASGAASFTAASVPLRSFASDGAAFSANFLPEEGRSVWHGRLSQWMLPFPQGGAIAVSPVGADACSTDDEIACLEWEVNASMLGLSAGTLSQVASGSDLASGNYRLGSGAGERRVLYPLAPSNSDRVGLDQRLLMPSTVAAENYDLWDGAGISYVVGDSASESNASQEATDAIRTTLQEKVSDSSFTGRFIVGDFFHSDPVMVAGPKHVQYIQHELRSGLLSSDCRLPNGDFDFSSPHYLCFFEKHRQRRQTILAGSNDGQIHAFDAGEFAYDALSRRIPRGEYTRGTGQELFSFIPRSMLPHVFEVARPGAAHSYGVDGSLVVDDVRIDPSHNGSPNKNQREWRSVAIGGLREGGRSYHALDITQPDELVENADGSVLPLQDSSYVPTCSSSYSQTKCGPLEYPAMLWEFTDSDLGDTWSKPNIGRVRVLVDGETVDKYVAVFGGGLDPAELAAGAAATVGNHLYMVDIETGKAIYKYAVDGAVPSEPAAVDRDGDSYLDTIYFGTTAGFLYKIDLSKTVELVTDMLGTRIIDPAWDAYQLFDSGNRPIFEPPSVIFVGGVGHYALAWGTGNREDLWDLTPAVSGRFIVFLDADYEQGDPALPADASRLAVANAADALDTLGNVLLSPFGTNLGGYVLELATHERLISRPLALSGLLSFATYVPGTSALSNPCETSGGSNLYTIMTTSGNPPVPGDSRSRYTPGMAISAPFVETSGSGTLPEGEGGGVPDELLALRDVLRTQQPRNCRFNNIHMNVKVIRSDTTVDLVAPIPVCSVEKNWKDLN